MRALRLGRGTKKTAQEFGDFKRSLDDRIITAATIAIVLSFFIGFSGPTWTRLRDETHIL